MTIATMGLVTLLAGAAAQPADPLLAAVKIVCRGGCAVAVAVPVR